MKKIIFLTLIISTFLISPVAHALQFEVAITARKTAAQSSAYSFTRSDVGVILQVDSTIAAGETVTIEQLDSDGVTWGSIY